MWAWDGGERTHTLLICMLLELDELGVSALEV